MNTFLSRCRTIASRRCDRYRRATILRLLVACLLIGGLSGSTFAAERLCDQCGAAIEGHYIQAGENDFCSKACYLKALPKCATCGQPIQGDYLSQNGTLYCSRKCFEASLPKCSICGRPLRNAYRIEGKLYCPEHAKGPRCAVCSAPVENGKKLPDDRRICSECYPDIILEREAAQDLYYKAAATIRRIVGRDLPIIPPMELAGRDELPSHDELDDGISVEENGRYIRNTETTTTRFFGKVIREKKKVNKKIIMLYGLTREQFLSTAAHELMHDIVSEQYHTFDEQAPDWAEEGVCQYASALLCRRLGLKAKLRDIENAEHPIYGGGYRYIARRFGESNWAAVARWMARGEFDSLPAEPPSS